jgi:hypothetical protein
MSENSFLEILHKPIDEIKEPVALSAGKYLMIVDGPHQHAKAGAKETDCVDFNLKPIQALDVDPNQLTQALNGEALQDKRIRHRLFVTPDSAYRLKRFLVDDLGIAPATIWQMLSEAPGKEVIVKITHQHSKNSATVYANVESTANVNSLAKVS